MPPVSHALAPAVETLAPLGEQPPLVLGPPCGDGWWTLTEASDRVHDWYPALVDRSGDRRAAAAFLATWVAEAPGLVIGLCAILGGLAPRLTGERLWLHRHADGWFDRHAVDPVEVHGGPGRDVLAEAGAHVAEVTGPVVDDVCAGLPVGPVAVWGGVAEAISGHALSSARALGIDELETWRRCQVLVDAIQEHAPALRHRPRRLPVAWSRGTAQYQVRGTCCLHYRTCEQPERDGEGYCATCPLRTDDSRIQRLRRHLEDSA